MKLPHLTVRDLFWLVLVVAMGCAWWVNQRRLATELVRASAANDVLRENNADLKAKMPWREGWRLLEVFEEYLKAEGYDVEWEGDGDTGNYMIMSPSGTGTAGSIGPGPSGWGGRDHASY